MARRKLWLWPLHPLQSGCGENIQREVDIEDGQTISLRFQRPPKYQFEGIETVTASFSKRFYAPTADDLAVMEGVFPGTSPSIPSWARVEARLDVAGVKDFKAKNAPTLVELLKSKYGPTLPALPVPESQVIVVPTSVSEALQELRQLQQDGFLDLLSVSQAVDEEGKATGTPRVGYCEPLSLNWPVERLTTIWQATAGALGPDKILPEASDLGLAAFLFGRSQRICRLGSCYAQIVDPLSVWIEALSSIGREVGPVPSLATLIQPDPRRATAWDLECVAERARYAARFYASSRDAYPANLKRAMDAQEELGRHKKLGQQVPHELNNNLIICRSNLRSGELNLMRVVNEIELVQHYASALLPDELAVCKELNSRNWLGHGTHANCEPLGVELHRLAAKLEWLKPPATTQKNTASTAAAMIPVESQKRPIAKQTLDWMLRKLEDERDGLAALPCKLVTLRFLHAEGDGRKYDSELLQSHPAFARHGKGCCIGEWIHPIGKGGRGSRHTRLFCDELGEKTSQTQLSREDWQAIKQRLESLAKVASIVLQTSIATDETREMCRDSDDAAMCLRFLAGVSLQSNSPVDPVEIRWPAASELNCFSWPRWSLYSPAILDPKKLNSISSDESLMIGIGLSQAAPPKEWFRNPPSNFYEVTIERFLERTAKVCRWLIERLAEPQTPASTPSRLPEMARQSAPSTNGIEPANSNSDSAASGPPERSLKLAHLNVLKALKNLRAICPMSRKTRDEVARRIDKNADGTTFGNEFSELARMQLIDTLKHRPAKGMPGGAFVTAAGLEALALTRKKGRKKG